MMTTKEESTRWHLDKGIPIALLITLFVGMFTASASGIWFAAGMTLRVEVLERQIVATSPMGERIIRLETKMDAVKESLSRIEAVIKPR